LLVEFSSNPFAASICFLAPSVSPESRDFLASSRRSFAAGQSKQIVASASFSDNYDTDRMDIIITADNIIIVVILDNFVIFIKFMVVFILFMYVQNN